MSINNDEIDNKRYSEEPYNARRSLLGRLVRNKSFVEIGFDNPDESGNVLIEGTIIEFDKDVIIVRDRNGYDQLLNNSYVTYIKLLPVKVSTRIIEN